MAKDKEEVKEYKLVEVPTQTAIMIQTPDEKIMTPEQALVELLNKVNGIVEILGSK